MILNKKEFTKAKVHYALTPGEALKIIRELQGLSQNDLAHLASISQSNISALENNMINLGRKRTLIFAKVLRVHPAVLLFPDFDMAAVA